MVAMEKTTVDGKTVNVRTADMIKMWEFNALTPLYVVQGSYNGGVVAQSGGTHDGGGAVDVASRYHGDLVNKKWIVKQGRLAGFALWLRPTIVGLWAEHYHGIAIGDPELSDAAARQVTDYYQGKNGLANHGPDPDPRIGRIKVWPKRRLKKVSALIAYRQFKAKNPRPTITVRRIQWVLNEKLGTNLAVDGIAGESTRNAFLRWEKKIDSPQQDGVPNKYSLRKLGEGRFRIGWLAFEEYREKERVARKLTKRLDAVRGDLSELRRQEKQAEEAAPTFN